MSTYRHGWSAQLGFEVKLTFSLKHKGPKRDRLMRVIVTTVRLSWSVTSVLAGVINYDECMGFSTVCVLLCQQQIEALGEPPRYHVAIHSLIFFSWNCLWNPLTAVLPDTTVVIWTKTAVLPDTTVIISKLRLLYCQTPTVIIWNKTAGGWRTRGREGWGELYAALSSADWFGIMTESGVNCTDGAMTLTTLVNMYI